MTSPRLPSFLCLLLTLTTTSFLFTIAQAEDDGNVHENLHENMFGSKDQVCPTYSCPSPYVPVNKWPLSIVSTGCQSTGGMGMMMMGGKSTYKHIEQCCHLKNACYQLCGSNKQTCDADMEKCMERNCKELPDGVEEDVTKEQADCKQSKSIIQLISGMGGCNEYDGHQARVCECVPKDKVEDKMERVFRNFYKKFHAEGADKVKGLLEKAKGKRAVFNKILYSLVKKYPAAIKKKEVEMPDPMKMDL